ncbi:short-subunit dehydrogenase [Stackebrandtia endophytica]|uniref:Short-subunit dehydrogenase n=1 Tax=Stackebrandtia endophytica TaxID=1496996 RepID=A0A543B4G6_9ACTN|nr:SDR family oxidoreductase [Stackebrandtia endophytica]TQL79683.1 short-subunit dehydrogenase [Stackebrandtia endophytica]
MTHNDSRTALITGASRGLGRALATELAASGWRLLLTARGEAPLREVAVELGAEALPGDVTDPNHRATLTSRAEELGGVDLLINNASDLGATPLPRLADYPLDLLPGLFDTNVVTPLALSQLLLPGLRNRGGAIINISSDAATGGYEGWGGYGATKAALDQISNVLAAEESAVDVWWVDPGEMRTKMLADAVGSDADDATPPEEVAPVILRLLTDRPTNQRYSIDQLRESVTA